MTADEWGTKVPLKDAARARASILRYEMSVLRSTLQMLSNLKRSNGESRDIRLYKLLSYLDVKNSYCFPLNLKERLIPELSNTQLSLLTAFNFYFQFQSVLCSI